MKLRIASFVLAVVASVSLATAQQDPQQDPQQKLQTTLDKAVTFLKSQQQPDGGWQRVEQEPPGITALVVRGLAVDPKIGPNDPSVQKGFTKLLTYAKPEGGIHGGMQENYNTAIAVSALSRSTDPAAKAAVDKAVEYLRRTQWVEGYVGPKGEEAKDKSHTFYGGYGYGRNSRPDMSNAHFSIEALHEAGLKPGDPAFERAMVFITRTQNLSETNDQAWAGNDGGFVYTPANKGESMAGEYTGPDGARRLRSYGSMTYAGLKSMIYAGLTKDDPRVKAAFDWIRNNFTLDENPGMRAGNPEQAQNGLYYYYMVMARAMNAYDQPTFTDGKGVTHDWRLELLDKIASLQREDGSWSGDKRWMEDHPVLVTSYMLIALQEIREDLAQHPPQR